MLNHHHRLLHECIDMPVRYPYAERIISLALIDEYYRRKAEEAKEAARKAKKRSRK